MEKPDSPGSGLLHRGGMGGHVVRPGAGRGGSPHPTRQALSSVAQSKGSDSRTGHQTECHLNCPFIQSFIQKISHCWAAEPGWGDTVPTHPSWQGEAHTFTQSREQGHG